MHNQQWLADVNEHAMIAVDLRSERSPFAMGSFPLNRAHHGRTPSPKKLDRMFAMSAYETTAKQFRNFLRDRPRPSMRFRGNEQIDAPVTRVSWLLAAEYCNWLSQEAGLPKSEWCFEFPDQSDRAQPRLAEDYLSRTGFRLPTEAEWEFCARAGTQTSRYFGDSESRLQYFAWFQSNSENSLHVVGQLMPNQLGFFDMLGNAREWCMEQWSGRVQRSSVAINDDREEERDVVLSRTRVTKGGAYDEPSIKLRAANRIGVHPLFDWTPLAFE